MRRLPPAVLLATIAAITLLVLLGSAAPPAVTLRADVRPVTPVASIDGQICTTLAVVPEETGAVRVRPVAGTPSPTRLELTGPGGLRQVAGPPVRRGHDLVFTLGRATTNEHPDASICFSGPRRSALLGDGTRPTIALLGAERASWLTAVPLLSERAAFGRGTVLGRAALPLGLLAVLAAWVLAVRLGAGPMRSPEPVTRRTVVLIGLIATLWGAAYAVTTPPFEAPDEMVHLRYVELIVDRQAVPRTTEARGDYLSKQLQTAIAGSGVNRTAFSPDRRPPWSAAEDRAFDEDLAALPSGGSRDTFDNASSQPPTYYAILAAGTAVSGGSILDRLLIARLLSALLFGLGVAGAVVFAREAVPRAGGLVVAAGIALACLPLVGFIGGSVNPDALLVATSAWALALTARILRRGVTWRRAIGLGALIGLGVVAKLTFAGLLPAFLLAAVVVLVRGIRAGDTARTAGMLVAAAAAAALVGLPYLGWAQLSGRGIAFGPPGPPAPVFHLREWAVYTVELFAGQFGPIADRIPESGPLDIWASGLAGRLGWLDYGFSRRVVLSFVVAWGVLAALAFAGVVRAARARRAFPVDALVYLVAVVSLAAFIARAGLTARLSGNSGFEQARYLFPIAAIGVGGITLALRTLPRERWRDWAAAVILVAALAHGTAGYLLTIGRYFA